MMIQSFRSATDVVQRARWGDPSELKDKKENSTELLDGKLLFYPEDPKPSEIILNPVLLQEKGDKAYRGLPDQPTRDVIFLHEALHEVIVHLQKHNKQLKEISEPTQHGFINHIFLHYFNKELPDKIDILMSDKRSSSDYKMLETSCRLFGFCDTNKDKGRMGEIHNMAPEIEAIGALTDVNRDGIEDVVGEGFEAVSGTMSDGAHFSGIAPAKHIPFLQNPNFANPSYPLDRFDECPVKDLPSGTAPWFIRELGKFDAMVNPWVRFYNQQRTMSFMPGERVIVLGEETPQWIQGIVVFVDERSDTFRSEVYAQMGQCRLVSIEKLALVMADDERLDMERVRQGMAGQNSQAMTTSEKRVADTLRLIRERFSEPIEKVDLLPPGERPAKLDTLRKAVFAELQNISKSFKWVPSGWENGALTLIGLPIMSQLLLAQKIE